jgi:Type I restriction enzyme HindI endonuclease subunit-like, C-terminal
MRFARGSFTASTGLIGAPERRHRSVLCCLWHRNTSLAQPNRKSRLLQAVTELSKAFALAVLHEDALRIRDDFGFFQAVRAALIKNEPGGRKSGDNALNGNQVERLRPPGTAP